MGEKEICIMNKPIIALASLTVLAGLSVGAFLYVKNKDDKEVQQQAEVKADNVLFSLNSDEITKIMIENSDGKYTFENIDDNWTVTECPGERFPLDTTGITALRTTFSILTADNNYGEITDEKKSMYGLDGTPYKLTVFDNEAHTMYIGAQSPTKDYYYVTVEGKSNIYAVNSGDIGDLLLTENNMRATDMLFAKETDITGVKLEKNGETVYDLSFDTDTSKWSLNGKMSSLDVTQTSITTMLNYMTRLKAASLLENHLEDLSKYGFDDPAAVLTIKSKDGTEEKLLFGERSSGTEFTPVLLTNTSQAANFYTGDIYFLDYTVLDFIPNVIEGANLYSVSGFEFTSPDYADSFTVDFTGKTGECRGKSLEFENASLYSLFESFYNTFSYVLVSDVDLDAKPDIKDAVVTAKYHYNDRDDAELALVDAGDNKAYIFVDGKYTGLLTELTMLSGNKSIAGTYKSMCELAGLEPQKKTAAPEAEDTEDSTEVPEENASEDADEATEESTEGTALTVEESPLAQ